MVAAGLLCVAALRELPHFGGPSEFAAGDDERGLQQSAIVQVFDKRRVGTVEDRTEQVGQLREVVLVSIPAGIHAVGFCFVLPVDGDKRDARFDETTRHQQTLSDGG